MMWQRFGSRWRPPVERGVEKLRAKRRRFRPFLEVLEPRTTPTIVFRPQLGLESASDGGGPVLSGVAIRLIFNGTTWGTQANPSQSALALETAVSNLVAGPYLTGLSEYRSSLGWASFDPVNGVAWDPQVLSTGFSWLNLSNDVENVTNNGLLPDHNATGFDALYVVVTDPGVDSGDGSEVGGYHSWYPDIDSSSASLAEIAGGWAAGGPVGALLAAGLNVLTGGDSVDKIYEAWVKDQVDPRDTTQNLSHEIVEAITDPTGGLNIPIVNPSGITVSGGQTSDSGNEICDREARSDTAVVNNVPVQSYWSQANNTFAAADGGNSGAFVIPQGGTQVFAVDHVPDEYHNSVSELVINGDQLGTNLNDVIGIDTTPDGGIVATLNGETAQFELTTGDLNRIQQIVVNPGAGNNTVAIGNTAVPVTINAAAGASDTTTIENIVPLGPVTIHVGTGAEDAIDIERTSATNSFSPALTVDLEAGGTANVTVGSLSHTLSGIQGGVMLDNSQGGYATLNMDDSSPGIAGAIYTMDAQSLSGMIYPNLPRTAKISYRSVNTITLNGSNNASEYDIQDTEADGTTTINTGAYDVVNVEGTTGALMVNLPSGGNPTVNITPSSQLLDHIQGPVTVQDENSAVNNTVGGNVNVYDQADQDPAMYRIDDSSLLRTALSDPTLDTTAPITWQEVSHINMWGSNARSQYNVEDTEALGVTTIVTGDFVDQVNVRNTTGELHIQGHQNDAVNIGDDGLQGIGGPVVLDGPGTALVDLVVDDSVDTLPRTNVMLSGTELDNLSPAPIAFPGGMIGSLTIQGGSGGDVFDVTNTPSTGETGPASGSTLDIAGGSDVVSVEATTGPLTVKLPGIGNPMVHVSPTAQNLQTIQGSLTVTGMASGSTGFGTLILDDQNYHDNQNNPFNFPIIYSLDASSVSRLYVASIGYSGLAALTLNGGSGSGRSYDIYNTAAETATTVNTANGDDVISVAATTGPLTVELAASGDPTVYVSPSAENLQTIQGSLTVTHLGSGTPGLGTSVFGTLILDDQNYHDNQDNPFNFPIIYSLDASSVSRLYVAAIGYSGLAAVTLNGGSGSGRSYDIYNTAADTTTTVNTANGDDVISVAATTGPLVVDLAAAGDPTVYVSPAAQNLQTNQGGLTVTHLSSSATGYGSLILDDQNYHNNLNNPANFPIIYGLDASSVSRVYVAAINYSGLAALTLNGGSGVCRTYDIYNTAAETTTTVNTANGDDVVYVVATTGPLNVGLAATSGNPTVNVATAQNLNAIQGNVMVAGSGVGTVNIDDQAGTAGRSYTLTSNNLAWGGAAMVGFSTLGSVVLNATKFNDTVTVQSLPNSPVMLNGDGGGNNTLIGPNTANAWLLAQPNGHEGTLDSLVVFDSFGSVIGGQGLDSFVVPDGATIPEFLSGGDGLHGGSNNTLDLSAWTSPLTEHIFSSVYGGNVTIAGSTTTVVRAFALCQNVIGGLSDDRFVFDQGYGLTSVNGGKGNNTLDFSPYVAVPPGWVFAVLGPNSGLVAGVISSFSNIQNLIGTKVNDRFGFRGTAYLDGTIDGGGGSNSLEYTQSATSVTVNLQSGLASYVNFQGAMTPHPGGISNIQKFLGGPGSGNTLIAPDTPNTWSITGLGSGTLGSLSAAGAVNSFTFNGFQNLTGGASSDAFAFQPGGGVSGIVDGAGGSDSYDVTFGSLPATLTIADSGPGTDGDSLTVHAGAGTNYIVKTATQIRWGNPASETVNYAGIENLTVDGSPGSNNTIIDPGSQNTTIVGGPGTNDVTIAETVGNGVVFQDGGGANTVTVVMGSLLGPVTLVGTTGTTGVTVLAPAGSNVLTLSSTQLMGAGETITFNLGETLTGLTVDGSAGSDQLIVPGSAPGPLVLENTIVGTVTAVTASSDPSILNQPVTFSATVSSAVAAAGTPAGGTVQFQIDGGNFGPPVPLNGGSASLTTSAVPAGMHTVAALYSGASLFLTSSGSLVQAVHYVFSGFLSPLNQGLAFEANRTVPIKFRLSDFNDAFVGGLSAVASLQAIATDSSGNPLPGAVPFNLPSTDNKGLHHDGDGTQSDAPYVFNWTTKGLGAGYYKILLGLADGTVQTEVLQVSTGAPI